MMTMWMSPLAPPSLDPRTGTPTNTSNLGMPSDAISTVRRDALSAEVCVARRWRRQPGLVIERWFGTGAHRQFTWCSDTLSFMVPIAAYLRGARHVTPADAAPHAHA